jgi:uncharacterized protein YyaL (SSP411 family)
LALNYRLGPTQEIVVAGQAQEAQPLLAEVWRRFLPNATVLFRETGERGDALAEIVPFVRDLVPREGHAAAYVCENYACRQPVTEPADLAAILDEISRSH